MKIIHKKETDKELAHDDVYDNTGVYLGYIIKDNPNIGTKFHFCGVDVKLVENTRDELIISIIEQYKT